MENDNWQEPIRLIITAPFPAVRAGLKALVEEDPNIQVIAECASPVEWASHISSLDIILLAPAGPISQKLMLQIAAQARDRPVLFLLSQPLAINPDITSRAWGALSLTASSEQILLAVRTVSQGFLLAQPELLPRSRNVEIAELKEESQIEPLTRREIEVLQCLALGLTNKEIAKKLKISPQTVKFHSSSIYTKLGAASRTEAVRLGVRLGWINL